MPTVKININTGVEYSPTDGQDSSVKLHNFTVGSDGSLYKPPVLKNLKNSKHKVVDQYTVWPYRILDAKKIQTSSLELPPSLPIATDVYDFHVSSLLEGLFILPMLATASLTLIMMAKGSRTAIFPQSNRIMESSNMRFLNMFQMGLKESRSTSAL